MINSALADELTAQAADAAERRKVLLTVAVAVRTTKTLTHARQVLTDWHGPGTVKAGALALLDSLTALPPGAAIPGGTHADRHLPVSGPAQEPVHGGGSRPGWGDPALPAPPRPRVGADHVPDGGDA